MCFLSLTCWVLLVHLLSEVSWLRIRCNVLGKEFPMKMRTIVVGIMCLAMLGGCRTTSGQVAGIVGSVVAGQLILESMKGGSPSGGGTGSSARGYEGCNSPDVYRAYFAQLRAAHPGALGWGGLSGGIQTIQQNCRLYTSIRPLMDESCVDVGYTEPACPFLADDSVRVWSIGRQPIPGGTGLLS